MRRKHRGQAAVLIGLIAVTAACGRSEPADGPIPEGTDAHAEISPVEASPQPVARAAMQTILSWQPATDASKTDALRRAQQWLSGELLDAALTPDPDSALRPDPHWEAWKQSSDVVTARCDTATDGVAIPDGARTVVVDVQCTQTVLHTSGQSTPLTPETWRTTLTETSDGWRLTSYRFHS
ncbi:hypothetical protein ONR57_22910 [Hoyosella sp. YIM 151337]|uniref:hypothetical protein n=1 Tax=Hoyosella sp. YIM 151337 TaxID=2992742 RepID=UPI0022363D7F|nr:hypothetical protein [Hoyosella sp. YIM 151337]MCW4356161.1 hypothetical protein [Hoyosella sp. YIM 151337]